MSNDIIADFSSTLDDVLLIIKRRLCKTNPNIEKIDFCVLFEGERAFRIAYYIYIKDQHTGEIHHHSLQLSTLRRQKKDGGWIEEKGHTISLQHDDEIDRLIKFLSVIYGYGAQIPNQSGDYTIIPEGKISEQVKQLYDAITTENGKVSMLTQAVALVMEYPDMFNVLAQSAAQDPDAFKRMVAVLNMGRFTAALRVFDQLIKADASEKVFQSLLEQNSWMFGSEYSELLPRRNWTVDNQQDFMLRRTSDDYLELIEIKKPLNDHYLFLLDENHKSYYPRSELTLAIGQVINYLNLLKLEEPIIQNRFGVKLNQIRAKIIIGRDYGDEKQIMALRQFNAHLHGIEILTFDQLYRIAERVLSFLEDEQKTPDLPF